MLEFQLMHIYIPADLNYSTLISENVHDIKLNQDQIIDQSSPSDLTLTELFLRWEVTGTSHVAQWRSWRKAWTASCVWYPTMSSVNHCGSVLCLNGWRPSALRCQTSSSKSSGKFSGTYAPLKCFLILNHFGLVVSAVTSQKDLGLNPLVCQIPFCVSFVLVLQLPPTVKRHAVRCEWLSLYTRPVIGNLFRVYSASLPMTAGLDP